MKKLMILFFSLTFAIGWSQEEEAVKNTIKKFFESFHAQDSVGMQSLVHQEITLQTIGAGKDGVQRLRTERFEDMIRSIVSIPDSVKFEEKILDYSVEIDGPMANVWTPYEFWLNSEFHHCGVNSFQLFKEAHAWKIIYLIDTRRREGCDNRLR
ncbi:nuclear transport factor 2 family protein [Maribacter aestuarii]|uniref:nuclear transport factor 2 family protein n=1 Tax=Maribacter aestuarii TaxID=1130723 RepID=UPI0025A68D24|nr:nuclear transport factor 2 family protein [Maribacter aestuarii]